jgi:TATA-box binding protein (TBP) (component of TFIID and TFIIIB)
MQSKDSKKPVLTIVTPTMSVEDTFNSLLKNLKKQGVEVKSNPEFEISKILKKELRGDPAPKTKD